MSRWLILLAAAVALTISGATSSAGARAGRCNAHAAHAIKRTPLLIVFAAPSGTDSVDGRLYGVQACLRPNGRPVRFSTTSDGDGEYPPNEQTGALDVNGSYVAAVSGTGFASAAACAKYEPGNPVCDQQVRWAVAVADARARRTLDESVPSDPVLLAVSGAGIVAWAERGSASTTLEAMVLRHGRAGRLVGRALTIDSGTITGPLRFTGRTLHWVSGGAPMSRTL